MDIPQLKLLAGPVRALLEQHDMPIGHSQSLDLIAALPGLRNWPEVNAFPDSVNACKLDQASCSRLAYRLKSKHGLDLSSVQILASLSPPTSASSALAPMIWPSGPPSGVYVTTSQGAINALLARYEEATDGELVYAEAAGSHWEGSIDLGEYGLSSGGLSRVPSGTLLIVGPLELDQQSWQSSAEKIEWACLRALNWGHRVAVLIKTPAPEQMCRDIDVMVRQVAPEGDDCYLSLTGIVTEDGDLATQVPFVGQSLAPVVTTVKASMDVFPESILSGLHHALSRRSVGIMAFGSSVLQEHRAMDLITAMLALTNGVGPVARIKSRSRGTPAKDMMVPDCVKVLPILPSVESAFVHGYRRMIVESSYTDVDTMLKYSDEVLFLMGSYGLDATNAFLETGRYGSFEKLDKVLKKLVAAVGVGLIEEKGRNILIGDLFVPDPTTDAPSADFEELGTFVAAARSVCWEDELDELLANKKVSLAAVKNSFKRQRGLEDFLAARSKKARVQKSA